MKKKICKFAKYSKKKLKKFCHTIIRNVESDDDDDNDDGNICDIIIIQNKFHLQME